MTVRLTERPVGDWDAGTTSGDFSPTFIQETIGRSECLPAETRCRAASWIDFVFPVREEDMSCRITEIAFSETTDEWAPRTPLGGKLLELRNQAVRTGVKLLAEDEVLEEVKRRRGEIEEDEADVC